MQSPSSRHETPTHVLSSAQTGLSPPICRRHVAIAPLGAHGPQGVPTLVQACNGLGSAAAAIGGGSATGGGGSARGGGGWARGGGGGSVVVVSNVVDVTKVVEGRNVVDVSSEVVETSRVVGTTMVDDVVEMDAVTTGAGGGAGGGTGRGGGGGAGARGASLRSFSATANPLGPPNGRRSIAGSPGRSVRYDSPIGGSKPRL
jgi:hypothetical protein